MQEQTLASDWRLWLISFWLFRPMGNKIKEPIRLEFNSYRNATQAKVSVYSHKASRGKRRRRRRIRNKETKKKMEKNTKDVQMYCRNNQDCPKICKYTKFHLYI